MMLQIAPVMDRVGFEAIDFTTSTHMAVAVRYSKQNPWDRLRLFRAAAPKTALSFLTTGMRFISWETASHEMMEFSFRLLVNNGIDRFAVMDPMNNVAAMLTMADLTRKAGGNQIVAALTFTLSPLHDDAHFADAARRLTADRQIRPPVSERPRRAGHARPRPNPDPRHQGCHHRAAGVSFALHHRPWPVQLS